MDALNFPSRCASICYSLSRSHQNNLSSRALDIGCAVGGTTFHLTKYYISVVGIDFSQHFIDAANEMKLNGRLDFQIQKQGNIFESHTAILPEDLDRSRTEFIQGDACNLSNVLGIHNYYLTKDYIAPNVYNLLL